MKWSLCQTCPIFHRIISKIDVLQKLGAFDHPVRRTTPCSKMFDVFWWSSKTSPRLFMFGELLTRWTTLPKISSNNPIHFPSYSCMLSFFLRAKRQQFKIRRVQFLPSDQNKIYNFLIEFWLSDYYGRRKLMTSLRSLMRWRNCVCGNVGWMLGAFDHLVRRTLKSCDFF